MLARITQTVNTPSTVRLHHDQRPNITRRNNRLRYVASWSNYFRYSSHVTASEAIESDGDTLAWARLEQGRTGRAELAPSERRMRALSRQTGSSNQLLSDGATFVEAARDPDVAERS